MTRDITPFARLCMLTAGILIAVPALVSARPTRTIVTGLSDVQNQPVGGDIVQDAAGNSHIQQLVQTGDFQLVESDCGDFTIQGTQLLVLNGVLDETGSGPIAGSFTVKDDAETVIWKGTMHGTLEALHFIGHITAHGQGPYAGLILRLDVEEIAPTPTTEEVALTEYILDPHGS